MKNLIIAAVVSLAMATSAIAAGNDGDEFVDAKFPPASIGTSFDPSTVAPPQESSDCDGLSGVSWKECYHSLPIESAEDVKSASN